MRLSRLVVVLSLLAAGSIAGAAQPETETVELAFGYAAENAAAVRITLGEGAVSLDLPRDASYPLDLVGASNGFLRRGTATPQDDGHVRVDLRLATGYLEGVAYRPDGLVLSFRRVRQSRTAAADAYRLGPEDKIMISISGQPELNRETVVTATGLVAAPLLGDLPGAGLTPGELSDKITEALARDFLVDPKVDVQVLEYKSQWAVVSGEVRNASQVPLRGGTDLKEVLAVAGGFGPEAGERIVVSHKDQATGQMRVEVVSRDLFERGEVNPRIQHGDIINVERAAYCYLNGEVRLPGRQRIERGMTLMRALSQAGGLTEWANRKAVQVRAEGEGKPPTTYDLREIERGKVQDPELRGGEVVTVRRRFL